MREIIFFPARIGLAPASVLRICQGNTGCPCDDVDLTAGLVSCQLQSVEGYLCKAVGGIDQLRTINTDTDLLEGFLRKHGDIAVRTILSLR